MPERCLQIEALEGYEFPFGNLDPALDELRPGRRTWVRYNQQVEESHLNGPIHDLLQKGVLKTELIDRTLPDITDERLEELAAQLKPVVREEHKSVRPLYEQTDFSEGSTFREIEIPDLRGVAFTWSPKPVGEPVDLLMMGVYQTYHDWNYHGMFKPSIAEVLACLDREGIPEGATHFWLDKASVQKEGEPLLHRQDAWNVSGYHKATVYVFRKQ